MSEIIGRIEAMEARMNNRMEAMGARLNNKFEALDVKIKDLATTVDRLELSRSLPSPACQINNLCHGCGQPGHFVSQCPDSPASSVSMWLKERERGGGAKRVFFYCDCCGGQNRNRIMITASLKFPQKMSVTQCTLLYKDIVIILIFSFPLRIMGT